jgi:hypothetical protein
MLDGDAHLYGVEVEPQILPLPYSQRLELARNIKGSLTHMGILVVDYR